MNCVLFHLLFLYFSWIFILYFIINVIFWIAPFYEGLQYLQNVTVDTLRKIIDNPRAGFLN